MQLKRLLTCLLAMVLMSSAKACEDQTQCIEPGSWQLGVALGAGVKTNPLVDGDDIPLVIIPDIAWYGDAFYFDNGELGYQLQLHKHAAVEAFVTPDMERAFFSFWHPANILTPPELSSSTGPDFPTPGGSTPDDEKFSPASVSIDDVASRDWTVNGGVRLHWYTQSGEFQLQWQHDALSVNDGYKVGFGYLHRFQKGDWHIAINTGIVYKSDNLINYYYGVSTRDDLLPQQSYQARGGWQPQVSATLLRPINDKWQFLFMAGYQRLHSGMTNSPLVRENSVTRVFAGLAYRF